MQRDFKMKYSPWKLQQRNLFLTAVKKTLFLKNSNLYQTETDIIIQRNPHNKLQSSVFL